MDFESLPIIEEKSDFQPLSVVDEDSKFQQVEITTKAKPSGDFKPIELPFKAKHPSLYGVYGAAKETGKSLIPYIKYIDPDERERFLQLDKQHQVRELLLQDLEAVALLAFDPAIKAAKSVIAPAMERFLPKTYKLLTKEIKLGSKVTKGLTPEASPDAPGSISPPEDMPKYASSVNLERQAIEKELKLTELRAAEGFPKKKMGWAEVDKQSAKILDKPEETVKVFEKIKTGTALNVVETDVVRKANVEGLYKFHKDIQAAGTPEEANAILNHYTESTFKPASEAAGEAGRVLQSYNKEIGLNRLGKAFSKLEKGLSDRELAEFKTLDIDNPAEVKGFIGRLGDPKLMDYVYEFWYNSILSGIPTHVVNVASNTAWLALQVPHRGLTGGVDKMISTLTGRARTRFMDEAIPMMAGMKTGFKRGAKGAADVVRHGKLQEFETKWAQEVGSALGSFDRSPIPAVRTVGKFLTVPTKALRAMDVWANSIGYDAQLRAIARRTANSNGLKGLPKKNFEEAFLRNVPEKAHQEAMEFAKYSTFMDDPGWFSSAIIKVRGKIPGGRFVVPFVNTIGNLLKRGVEMTPGVGLSLAKGKNPAEVIAKQIEGSIVSLYVLHKADKGEITGAAPKNKTEREAFYRQGKKAWSIRVGDKWVQYRRIEPFNTVIASAAIAYDRIKTAKDEEGAIETFANMAGDFKNNLIDSSYLQGVTQLLNRHGTLKDFPKRTLPSLLVPYSGFFRSINRAYEAATEGTAKVRDTDSWIGAFSTTIPGLSKDVPPRLTVWGEDVVLEGGVFRQWIPYKWSTQKPDITEDSLGKIGVYPGHPQQTIKIKGKKTKLDDDIYRDFLIAYGHRAKSDLDKYFSKPHVQRALEDEKKYPVLISSINSILTGLKDSYRVRAIREQLKRK